MLTTEDRPRSLTRAEQNEVARLLVQKVFGLTEAGTNDLLDKAGGHSEADINNIVCPWRRATELNADNAAGAQVMLESLDERMSR